MSDKTPVAVTSRSFSRHPILRAELLERYEDVRFNEDGVLLEGSGLVRFLRGRTKAITALERIDAELLDQLPELKLISKVGVGTDMIDIEAVEGRNIVLNTSSGTNSRSVAELVIAFAICALRHLVPANRAVLEGDWKQLKGHTLSDRCVGILGFGNVGRDLARLLKTFGCDLICHDSQDVSEAALECGVSVVDMEELLARSDILSVHLTFNSQTRYLLNGERLAKMKPTAVLINTSRGQLVDESALKVMLREGKLAAAAFDVFAAEPPEDRELLKLPNFIATPHMGGSTEEAILAMGRAAIAGLEKA